MNRLILTLLITLLCSAGTFCEAQLPSIPGLIQPKKVALVQTRPLIVVVETENPKVVDKFKNDNKEAELKDYQKAIEDYNQGLKEAVTKFWTYSSNVVYKTNDEVVSLIKEKNKDYVLLYCATFSHGGFFNYGIMAVHKGLDWTYADFKHGKKDDKDFLNSTTVMEVKPIEDYNSRKSEPICQVGLQDVFPLESDFILGIRFTQWFLANGKNYIKTMKINGETLARKTLLIRNDYVDPELSRQAIGAVYPFKFEIADSESFETHISDADSDYACVIMTPWMMYSSGRNPANNASTAPGSPQSQFDVVAQQQDFINKNNNGPSGYRLVYYYFVIDAGTGNVLGEAMPSMESFMGIGFSTKDIGNSTVNSRVFKLFAGYGEGKGLPSKW